MKYRKFFSTMIILIILSGITSLAVPLLLQGWRLESESIAADKIILIIAMIFLSKAVSVVLTVFREFFAQEYNKKNFMDFLNDYFHLKYDVIVSNGPMNMLEKIIQSVNSIYAYMTGGYIQIYSCIFIEILCLMIIGSIDISLVFLMLLGLFVNYFGYSILNRKLKSLSQNMQNSTGQGFQEILSAIQHTDYVKQLSSHDEVRSLIMPSLKKAYGSMARVNEYAQAMTVVLQGITEIVQTLLMLILIYGFTYNHLSPFTLIIGTLIIPLYFSSVNTLVNCNMDKTVFHVAQSYKRELETNAEEEDGVFIDTIENIRLDIRELCIPGNTLNFSARANIHKGDIVQICGENGTGKSTFAKALLKFRSADGIFFNDIPIENINKRAIRSIIEYVPQSAPIIHGTIRDNLLFNVRRKGISDEELYNNVVIKSLLETKSLDEHIIEGGSNLSGGEKQKIALARALLAEPEVLVLDEACSNIDGKTSQLIYEYIEQRRARFITFIISHEPLPEGLVNIWIND